MSVGAWEVNQVHCTDALTLLKGLPDESVHCVVTSPPYFGLRSYTDGDEREIGKEQTPEQYVEALVSVFREARRVLRSDGTFWLNLGDSYNNYGTDSLKRVETSGIGLSAATAKEYSRKAKRATEGLHRKQLLMIPARVALALQADGWLLRADIIWAKPNPMPESVTDRPTKSHEKLYLLTKSGRYFYDAEAIKEDAVNGDPTSPRGSTGVLGQQNAGRRDKQGNLGKRAYTGFNARWDARTEPLTKRNKRDVWTIPTQPFPGAHFAVMPEKLVEPCILAGCPQGGIVLDPFMGSGTVARVARRHERQWIGSEINPEYVAMTRQSLSQMSMYEYQLEATP